MKTSLMKNKDFWAGLMLILLGAGAMYVAQDYRFGSALRMGPGFFPTILSGILIVFGIAIMTIGLKKGEEITEKLSLRSFFLIILSFVLFGFLMDKAGFVPALVVLIFTAAYAGREFRLVEVLLLTAALVTGSVALFVWALGLPYQLIKGF